MFQIKIFYNDTWNDISNYVKQSSITKTEYLHNKLQSNSNSCTFSIIENIEIINNLINTNDNIECEILKDTEHFFKGIISPNYNIITEYRGIENLQLQVEDYTNTKLKKKITSNIKYLGYKICDTTNTSQSIIHQLLNLANVEYILTQDINITVPIFVSVIDDNSTYLDIIQSLLFESGSVLYFDAAGKVNLYFYGQYDLGIVNKTFLNEIDNPASNIYNSIDIKKSREEYDEVLLKWSTLEQKTDITVFNDSTGSDSSHLCNIEVLPSQYYPADSDARNVYSEYKSDEYDLFAVISGSLDITHDGLTVYKAFQNYGKKGLFAYYNNTGNTKTITKLKIKGTAFVKKELNITREEINTEVLKSYEYEVKYLYNQNDIDSLSLALKNYFKNSDFIYSITSDTEYNIGDYVKIEDRIHLNAETFVRIVGKTTYDNRKTFEYTCEGVSSYIPALSGFTETTMIPEVPSIPLIQDNIADLQDQINNISPPEGDLITNESLYTDFENPTFTTVPNIPTLEINEMFKSIELKWDEQTNLVGELRTEIQVSLNQTEWYELGSGLDWKIGNDGTYSKCLSGATTFIHASIPFDTLQDVNGEDYPVGKNLFYRVRRRTRSGDISEWSNIVLGSAKTIEEGMLGLNVIKANNIEAGSITADKLEADFLTASIANINETLSIGEDGFLATSSIDEVKEYDTRGYLDKDEVSVQIYKDNKWESSSKIGAGVIRTNLISSEETPLSPIIDLPSSVIGYDFDYTNPLVEMSGGTSISVNGAIAETSISSVDKQFDSGFITGDRFKTLTANGYAGTNNTLTFTSYAGGSTYWGGTNGYVIRLTSGTYNVLNLGAITNTIYDVKYCGTLLILVGAGGKLFTSTDGITWTSRTSGVATDINAVAGIANDYFYVGAGGVIRTSTDGITWTSRTSGVSTDLISCAEHSSYDLKVAVGMSGVIRTSTDGITWTGRTSGTGSMIKKVIRDTSRNMFVAVGGQGYISTSSDGITWTVRTSNTTNMVVSVVNYGTKLIAITDGCELLESTDGITWTNTPITNVFDRPYTVFQSMDGNLNSTIYIIGANTSYTAGEIYTITNGTTWNLFSKGDTNQSSYIATTGQTSPSSIKVGNNGSIVGYYGANLFRQYINTSASLISIIKVNSQNVMIVAGSSGLIARSTDFQTWTIIQNTGYHISKLIECFGKIYAFHSGGSAGSHYYYSEDYGLTWNNTTINELGTLSVQDASFGNNTLVITAENKIYKSTDGITFTLTKDFTTDLAVVFQVAFFGNFFIAGSKKGFYIIRSTNGEDWEDLYPYDPVNTVDLNISTTSIGFLISGKTATNINNPIKKSLTYYYCITPDGIFRDYNITTSLTDTPKMIADFNAKYTMIPFTDNGSYSSYITSSGTASIGTFNIDASKDYHVFSSWAFIPYSATNTPILKYVLGVGYLLLDITASADFSTYTFKLSIKPTGLGSTFFTSIPVQTNGKGKLKVYNISLVHGNYSTTKNQYTLFVNGLKVLDGLVLKSLDHSVSGNYASDSSTLSLNRLYSGFYIHNYKYGIGSYLSLNSHVEAKAIHNFILNQTQVKSLLEYKNTLSTKDDLILSPAIGGNVVVNGNIYSKYITYATDCFYKPYDTFATTVVAAGSFTTAVPNTETSINHQGIIYLKSGTTANGGGLLSLTNIATTPLSYRIVGSEKGKVIFKPITSHTGRTYRFGIHNTATITAPTYGVYYEIVAGVVSLKVRINSIDTYTLATGLTLTIGTWYRFEYEINANATAVLFNIYTDDNDTLVYSQTVSTALPTAINIDARFIATESSTTASDICYVDYIDFQHLRTKNKLML